MFKKLSKPLVWLLVLLMVVIVSSFFASMVQNSFFSVKVDKISFETERGELAGYLYIPNDVDENNPAPAVILTHGYLNNSEMQEIGAIELSRRGYVVLAFDMYDHGDSTWETPAAFNFFVRSVYDAVQYIYDQDYVLKDATGNGMIGVSGHSMGGFSSTYAVVFDEMDFAVNGYRKIAAALPVGSDFRYIGVPDAYTMFGTRSVGIIAAQYDQFFFDNSAAPVGSVIKKDFTEDAVGLAFLGRTVEGNAEAGEIYNVAGGQRVIYTPDETHPQNTWSLESGKNTIEFFDAAFKYQFDLSGLNFASSGIEEINGQIWWLKEAFTLTGLIALIMMLFPAFTLVTQLPIFNKVYNENLESTVEVLPMTKEKKYLKIILVALATLLSFYYIVIFMDRQVAGLTQLGEALYYVMAGAVVVALAVWIAAIITKGIKGENTEIVKIAQQVTLSSSIIVFISLAFRWLIVNTQILSKVTYWSAPSFNTIVYWALCSAGLILLISFVTTPIFNQGEKVENPYGIKATPWQLLSSLLTAIALTTGLLLIVAIIGWVFLTDFRFYTYAIQIFNSHQFVAALRYMPVIIIYYFAAAISVYTNTKNIKHWLGDVYAAFLLAGPIVLFLIYQYSVLYNTGVAAYPTFSLNAILTVGLVPTLSIAGIIMRRFSIKTGNIWTSVFFTTLFFTLITLANTVVYLLQV